MVANTLLSALQRFPKSAHKGTLTKLTTVQFMNGLLAIKQMVCLSMGYVAVCAYVCRAHLTGAVLPIVMDFNAY